MTKPHYEVDHHEILKDGHRMFLEDVVDDIRALQRKVDNSDRVLSCSAPAAGCVSQN